MNLYITGKNITRIQSPLPATHRLQLVAVTEKKKSPSDKVANEGQGTTLQSGKRQAHEANLVRLWSSIFTQNTHAKYSVGKTTHALQLFTNADLWIL